MTFGLEFFLPWRHVRDMYALRMYYMYGVEITPPIDCCRRRYVIFELLSQNPACCTVHWAGHYYFFTLTEVLLLYYPVGVGLCIS